MGRGGAGLLRGANPFPPGISEAHTERRLLQMEGDISFGEEPWDFARGILHAYGTLASARSPGNFARGSSTSTGLPDTHAAFLPPR